MGLLSLFSSVEVIIALIAYGSVVALPQALKGKKYPVAYRLSYQVEDTTYDVSIEVSTIEICHPTTSTLDRSIKSRAIYKDHIVGKNYHLHLGREYYLNDTLIQVSKLKEYFN